jgi:hypothetical protein
MEDEKKNQNPQWDRFKNAMNAIIAVPHSEIAAHLEKEREAKRLKRSRKSRYRAFRAVNKSG